MHIYLENCFQKQSKHLFSCKQSQNFFQLLLPKLFEQRSLVHTVLLYFCYLDTDTITLTNVEGWSD